MEEYTQITLDEWTQWKEDIRRKLTETAGNFVYIGYRLKQIRESGMFDGAADVFEFAQNEYGLGKSTVSRFIAINEKYSEGGNSLELKEEYRNFSSSKLSEMLSLPDSECELITEKTTIKEIRELKNFTKQEIPEDVEQAAVERTPLENCIIDYFEKRKETLENIMKLLNQEEPAYKEAAELMNPSGQSSYKKGIVFLFLYDWNMGVKYKLLTSPKPVSMTWPEYLNEIFKIYAGYDQENLWKDFYGADIETVENLQEEEKEPKKQPEENASEPQTNQGIEPSVATSQQVEKAEEIVDKTEEEDEHSEEPTETVETEERNVENTEESIEVSGDMGETGDAGGNGTGEPAGEKELSEMQGTGGDDGEPGKEDDDTETEQNCTDTEENSTDSEENNTEKDEVITIPITKLMKQASVLSDYLYDMFVMDDDIIPNREELQRCEEKAQELAAVIGQIMEVRED